MNHLKHLIGATFLILSLPLAGCTPTLMTDAAQAAFEDRITEDQVTDLKIASHLLKQLLETDKNLALDVGIDVWEQRLLLTGTLDSPEALNQVLGIASGDPRVREIYNEIRIVSTSEKVQRREQAENQDSAESGVTQTVNDYWLETKIKGQLIAEKGVRSVNYRWRSVQNIIYIIGRARSQEELDLVKGVIKSTKGVRDIKTFINIKPVS